MKIEVEGNKKRIECDLPCKLRDIQNYYIQLNLFELPNREVIICKVLEDETLNRLLIKEKTTIDDLNYLIMRIESLDKDAYDLFISCAEINGMDNVKSLIDLTKNRDKYELITHREVENLQELFRQKRRDGKSCLGVEKGWLFY